VKVSLVTTVLNADGHVADFLESVAAQSRAPDEIVVVDGGSTDGTLETLRSSPGITLIEEAGAGIARGRNVAIAATTHDVIAVSDADCLLEPDWLERLMVPLEAGADVAMGAYRPIARTFLERCMAAVNLPDRADGTRRRSCPRTLGRVPTLGDRRGRWVPEWLAIGEDMYVNHRWRELGMDMRLARDAVAWWRLRPDLRSTWTQYFRYARGDAIAEMYPERHALRYGVYGGALYALGSRGARRKLAALGGAVVYTAAPVRRAFALIDDPAERVGAVAAVPGLIAFVDVAKMAGYLAGMAVRARSERPGGRARRP
jgi:glycosyltransferase involved in cell wall biosynthesis